MFNEQMLRYDTIRVYLTCSAAHGTNKQCKRKKLKTKLMSVISLVKFHDHEGSPMGKEVNLRWEGFVKKVCFVPGVKK